MSTDTAFALGMLAIVGRRFPNSLRAFILTVAVVDDLVALIVIAVVFTDVARRRRAGGRAGRVAVILAVRRRGFTTARVYAVLGVTAWVALKAPASTRWWSDWPWDC